MNKTWVIMTVVSAIGVLLGVLYFGGLWWTVRRAVKAGNPALWFLGSYLLRTVAVLGGFYLAGNGSWEKMVWCLLGFILARFIVLRFTRAKEEGNHAP